MKDAPTNALTELEGTVLGLVALYPGCTAYAVRRHFQSSRTTYWRASAGSVYPLIERLAKRRLLVLRALPKDGRGTRQLQLTRQGEREVLVWLQDKGIAAAAPDPVRTRMHFLAMVSPHERRRLLVQWVAETETEIATLREILPEGNEWSARYERLGIEGALAQLAARQTWLNDIISRACLDQE